MYREVIGLSLSVVAAMERTLARSIGNESVPIQLAQCRFPGLAISNAKIFYYIFSNKISGSNFIKRHSKTGLKLPKCWLQFEKKIDRVIYYNFRHTVVSYRTEQTAQAVSTCCKSVLARWTKVGVSRRWFVHTMYTIDSRLRIDLDHTRRHTALLMRRLVSAVFTCRGALGTSQPNGAPR